MESEEEGSYADDYAMESEEEGGYADDFAGEPEEGEKDE